MDRPQQVSSQAAQLLEFSSLDADQWQGFGSASAQL
jgi:hypothetical protein